MTAHPGRVITTKNIASFIEKKQGLSHSHWLTLWQGLERVMHSH